MSQRLAELSFTPRGSDGVLATIVGEIDGSNASEVRRAVADNVPSSVRLLLLDLSETSYIDSAGVELIFDLARRLSARRQTLGLVVPAGSGVRRVLDLCDVASVAVLHSTLADANNANDAPE